jgi:hypothetical protein
MAGVVPYLPASSRDYGRERGRHYTRPSHMRARLGGRNGQQARGSWPGGQIAVATRQKSTARRLVSAMPGRRAQVALGKIALGEISVGKISVGKISVGKISVGKISVGKISLGIRAGTLPMLCGTAAAVTI